MSVNPDYDEVAEVIRLIMLKRLSPDDKGQRFAVLCLHALARDDKLSDLLLGDRK